MDWAEVSGAVSCQGRRYEKNRKKKVCINNSNFELTFSVVLPPSSLYHNYFGTPLGVTDYKNFLKTFLTVFKVSLKFFQKLPSGYIFINCTNLLKFVKIVFDTYLNFIKLSNFLIFSRKQVRNFNKFSVKFTQILFIIYPRFIKIFSKIFKISVKCFQIFL